MSVSRTRQIGPTPQDVEFKAMQTTLEIVPSIKLAAFDGLDGSSIRYGPLIPPQRATVPLWFAIVLKKKKKCRFVVPKWLTISELEATLKEETTDDAFSDLPRHYLEVSKVILEVAHDDVPDPDRAHILLKDIREARQSKVRAGLEALNPVHLAMPNLSLLELSELRSFFSLTHSKLSLLDPERGTHQEMEELWMEKPNEMRRRAELGEFEGLRERGVGGGDGDGEGY